MSQAVDETLVGHWAGTVSYGTKLEDFTIDLHGDGTADLRTAETGGPGTWQMTGADALSFTITERLDEGDSGVSDETEVTGIDHLIIHIEAKVYDGKAFAGGGQARVFDVEGNIIFAIEAETTAKLIASQ